MCHDCIRSSCELNCLSRADLFANWTVYLNDTRFFTDLLLDEF